VQGVAMNSCDHKHAAGEGRFPIRRKRPVTPRGKAALVVKTRKKYRLSNPLIIKKRK